MTSKRQITIPKKIADEYGIAEGDDVMWIADGEAIKILPHQQTAAPIGREDRIQLFDQATKRQRQRDTERQPTSPPEGRGWTREELYDRGGTR